MEGSSKEKEPFSKPNMTFFSAENVNLDQRSKARDNNKMLFEQLIQI